MKYRTILEEINNLLTEERKKNGRLPDFLLLGLEEEELLLELCCGDILNKSGKDLICEIISNNDIIGVWTDEAKELSVAYMAESGVQEKNP